MGKQVYVMKNLVIFEADENAKSKTFKEAIENGEIKIVDSEVKLFQPDGKRFKEAATIEALRQAIIIGLKEKA